MEEKDKIEILTEQYDSYSDFVYYNKVGSRRILINTVKTITKLGIATPDELWLIESFLTDYYDKLWWKM
jgi:hypothetical protein